MQKLQQFLRAGHFPTLVSSFLYFDFSFMIWMLLAALGIFLSEEFGLGPAQKGLMVSIPLLGGTLLRIPMGLLSDRFGSKKVALSGMAVTMIPLVWGWLSAKSMPEVVCIGLLLGVAGASFAVALPLASRWYPAKYQGLVMGIAGAGNSGSVLATLFAPSLAKAYGWHSVFGLAIIPMSIVFLFFLFTAKDCPGTINRKGILEYFAPIKSRDAITFCLLYSVTFGGFVGIASFLPIFFYDQYGIEKVTTGLYTSYCIIGASMLRPVGGYLSDKFGGVNVLSLVLLTLSVILIGISYLFPVNITLPLFIGLMACLGLGNGSVFQLVPLRFKKDIGVVTGFVGAFGGLGGFLVPNLLGSLKSVSGSFATGFVILALITISSAALVFFTNLLIWKKADSNQTELGLEGV
ncbi:nitrate transporter [Leptospira inadai serovar Lyme str. 10]|uniref:Nitrate transporter n=2 Tax=Leptospira inadai serovar Lyme TaxID=293084 RepID=V6HT20_9LEPT|nr:MFS transporter [Leptospira inadai]EQA35809.1 nitrate transporter [Leptospira inadai serovar Lyme str. 10]PNV76755.1 MFS transporter [Leptospira inadai serovar Lyme]